MPDQKKNMKKIIFLTTATGLFFCAACLASLSEKEKNEIKKIMKETPVLIDVRGKADFNRDAKIRNKIPDQKKPLVLYCSSGIQSAIAIDHLKKMGYIRLYNAKNAENIRALQKIIKAEQKPE